MSRRRLEKECGAYAVYLIGQAPTPYVLQKYLEYHAQWAGQIEPAGSFDRFLVEISARNSFWARMADTYASRFHKDAAVRKKLVLMLALLECSPGSFEYLDSVERGGIPAVLLRLAWHAAVYAGSIALSILLFFPVEAWTAIFAMSGKTPAVES